MPPPGEFAAETPLDLASVEAGAEVVTDEPDSFESLADLENVASTLSAPILPTTRDIPPPPRDSGAHAGQADVAVPAKPAPAAPSRKTINLDEIDKPAGRPEQKAQRPL